MTNTSITILTMKRKFDVPAEKVFDAWTNVEKLKKWMFTMEHTNKVAESDPRVGGTWEIVDHRDGKDYRAFENTKWWNHQQNSFSHSRCFNLVN
ncbi:SRPBCC family protein [Mesobacillus maritimus]|uniref:SRPBCC family protein n=1 Tax=Mesobacillus maritimus TaxID=1643336 RepID=UPI0031BB3878